MNLPVDISSFPTGAPDIDYDEKEQIEGLPALCDEALAVVKSFKWAPPVDDIVLAFGLAPVIGLFLVRFAEGIHTGEGEGDSESWIVVGDLPAICFETDVTTPADALRLYCAIGQDWADNVLANADLSESYPIRAEATREHAEMLLSRIEFIREKLVPLA